MSASKTVVEIRRFVPEKDAEPHWQPYEIETRPGMTILEGLHRVREQHDPTLAWRASCRMGVCGSCAMVINGRPGLACNTQIHDVGATRVRLEALWNFPLIKDLVADLAPMLDHHRRLKPYLIRSDLPTARDSGPELHQTP